VRDVVLPHPSVSYLLCASTCDVRVADRKNTSILAQVSAGAYPLEYPSATHLRTRLAQGVSARRVRGGSALRSTPEQGLRWRSAALLGRDPSAGQARAGPLGASRAERLGESWKGLFELCDGPGCMFLIVSDYFQRQLSTGRTESVDRSLNGRHQVSFRQTNTDRWRIVRLTRPTLGTPRTSPNIWHYDVYSLQAEDQDSDNSQKIWLRRLPLYEATRFPKSLIHQALAEAMAFDSRGRLFRALLFSICPAAKSFADSPRPSSLSELTIDGMLARTTIATSRACSRYTRASGPPIR
jgi:hypothetical protein